MLQLNVSRILRPGKMPDGEGSLHLLENSAWGNNIAVHGVAEMLHINFNVLNTSTPCYVINLQPAEGPSPHTLHLAQMALHGTADPMSIKRQLSIVRWNWKPLKIKKNKRLSNAWASWWAYHTTPCKQTEADDVFHSTWGKSKTLSNNLWQELWRTHPYR